MPWYSGIAKAFGFGAKVPEASGPPTKNIGHGGTAVFGGFPDSPEKSPELRGQRKYKTYDELKYNLDIVATGLRRTLMLAKGATWRVQPAKDSGREGERVAEAIHEILLAPRAMNRPFPRVVTRQFMHVFDGASIAVWTGKRRDDGLFGLLDVQPRPLATIVRWDVDMDGTLRGVWQQSPWTLEEIPIPRARMVYTADLDLSDSPEGTGILRHAAQTASELRRLQQIEGWGFETSLGGVPIVRIPYAELNQQVKDGKLTKQQAEDFVKGAKKFIEDRVITPGRGLALESMTFKDPEGKPSAVRMFDLELLSVVGGDQPALGAAIERRTRAIARLLGIEHLLIGDNSKGGYSLSKDKTQMQVQIINSGLYDCADAFDHDLIGPLMGLNGFDRKLTPSLVPSQVMLRDVEAIVDGLEGLAKAALDPDDEATNEVRELLGISPAPERTARELAEDATVRPGRRGAKPDPDDGSIDIDMDED
jgi:hypothetical protein